MTKREMFVAIANVPAVAENLEMVEFLNHQIELLDNRKTSEHKGLTATQKANVEVKETILAVLREADSPLTVTEMLSDERLSAYTNQKISALLRQLMPEVVKTMDGKKARFALT